MDCSDWKLGIVSASIACGMAAFTAAAFGFLALGIYVKVRHLKKEVARTKLDVKRAKGLRRVAEANLLLARSRNLEEELPWYFPYGLLNAFRDLRSSIEQPLRRSRLAPPISFLRDAFTPAERVLAIVRGLSVYGVKSFTYFCRVPRVEELEPFEESVGEAVIAEARRVGHYAATARQAQRMVTMLGDSKKCKQVMDNWNRCVDAFFVAVKTQLVVIRDRRYEERCRAAFGHNAAVMDGLVVKNA